MDAKRRELIAQDDVAGLVTHIVSQKGDPNWTDILDAIKCNFNNCFYACLFNCGYHNVTKENANLLISTAEELDRTDFAKCMHAMYASKI